MSIREAVSRMIGAQVRSCASSLFMAAFLASPVGAGTAQQSAPIFGDCSSLLQACQLMERVATQPSQNFDAETLARATSCVHYVDGVAGLAVLLEQNTARICPSGNWKMGQIVTEVMRWMDRNPAKQGDRPARCVYRALLEAFPCPVGGMQPAVPGPSMAPNRPATPTQPGVALTSTQSPS